MQSKQWKSIMVAVRDPYHRPRVALPKAIEVAKRMHAKVTLFNSFLLPSPLPDASPTGADMIPVAIADRRKRLDKMARPFREAGIDVSCEVAWDCPPHEAIIRYALKSKPDVIMAESHRHGRFARWLLANTDWELIRACPCPVWFVKTAKMGKKAALLAAVDPLHAHAKPSRLDENILNIAQHLAGELSGDMMIAHAYEAPITYATGSLVEPARLPISPRHARDLKAVITKKVNALAEKFSVPPSRRFIHEGSAAQVLMALTAKQKPDLLVMGAVSRSALKRVFIGNTAEVLIDEVPCDVLIVKPHNFKTNVSRTSNVALRTSRT